MEANDYVVDFLCMKAQGATVTEMECSKCIPSTTHDVGESRSQQHRDESNAIDSVLIFADIKLLSRHARITIKWQR